MSARSGTPSTRARASARSTEKAAPPVLTPSRAGPGAQVVVEKDRAFPRESNTSSSPEPGRTASPSAKGVPQRRRVREVTGTGASTTSTVATASRSARAADVTCTV
ncbi:MAG: hypothetical protein KC656_23740 [Myxococcales bacterium]|nr:hypothetical protein [Myxococcales bacterium]